MIYSGGEIWKWRVQLVGGNEIMKINIPVYDIESGKYMGMLFEDI